MQQTNGRGRFPLVPFSVCRIPETWRHGEIEMETWKQEDIDIKDGNMETRKNGEIETWRHGHGDMAWRHDISN